MKNNTTSRQFCTSLYMKSWEKIKTDGTAYNTWELEIEPIVEAMNGTDIGAYAITAQDFLDELVAELPEEQKELLKENLKSLDILDSNYYNFCRYSFVKSWVLNQINLK